MAVLSLTSEALEAQADLTNFEDCEGQGLCLKPVAYWDTSTPVLWDTLDALMCWALDPADIANFSEACQLFIQIVHVALANMEEVSPFKHNIRLLAFLA